VRSVEAAKEGRVRSPEEALLKRFDFLKVCGGGLAGVVARPMPLGAAQDVAPAEISRKTSKTLFGAKTDARCDVKVYNALW
jgi:hypothetical protein